MVASSTARAIATMHREVKLAPDETSEIFSRQTGDFLRLTPDRYTKNETQARAETIGIPSKEELFVELQEAKVVCKVSCPELPDTFSISSRDEKLTVTSVDFSTA